MTRVAAKRLFVAKVGEARNRFHGSGPVAEQALFAVAGRRDDPNQYQAVVELKQARAAAVRTAEAVDRDRGTRRRGYSRTQEGLSYGCPWASHAWDFELIAP